MRVARGMKRSIETATLAVLLAGATSLLWADAASMQTKVTASLTGSEQVPPVQTKGSGQFQGTIAGTKSISYRLTFSRPSSRVTAAHIHLGKTGTNGGVIVFFCGGGGKRSCPASGGTVTGTITGADVNPQPATGTTAGIKRGDLAGTIQAIMNGDTYVNVHTTKYPDGEIRGQIQAGK